jgi:tetratricopeptide (TPR) repeat protein
MRLRGLCVRQIEISLRGGSRSLPFLFTASFVSLFLGAETLLVRSDSWFETPAEARLISVLDENNARAQYRFGQIYQGSDPAESVRHLRRATGLSPYSRLYWSELASACESIGDTTCADQATERLLKLCPMVPLYRWQAAQNDLQNDRLDMSLLQFRRLLQLDPGYASGAWASLQNVVPAEVVFRRVLADRVDSEIKVGYVDFLSTQEDYDSAYRIWRLVVTNARPFPFSSAQAYLDRLISRDRMEEAVHVWHDLQRLGIVEKPAVDDSEGLVFNGDFEQTPLDAAFDWRSSKAAYLRVDFSALGAYHGAHCLRVDYTAPCNNEYEPVYQIVPVLPNHTYVAAAYARSEGLTSDTGPCLRVRDSKQPSFQDAVSAPTVGTTDWHPVRLSFSTGPATRSIRLSLWRPLGREFPMDISGSVWLDAVSLKCMDCTDKRGLQGWH